MKYGTQRGTGDGGPLGSRQGPVGPWGLPVLGVETVGATQAGAWAQAVGGTESCRGQRRVITLPDQTAPHQTTPDHRAKERGEG